MHGAYKQNKAKHDPIICNLQENHLKYNMDRLNVKGQKKICHASTNKNNQIK